MVGAAKIVEMNPRQKPTLGLSQAEERLLVEQLLLDVGVEDLKFAVHLGNCGDELVHFKLFQKARKLADTFPSVEGTAAVAHGLFRLTVAVHSGKESLLNGGYALSIPKGTPDDEARKIVEN